MKLKNFMFSCEHKFFDSHEQCVSILAASQQDAERIFAVYYPHWFVLEAWQGDADEPEETNSQGQAESP